ncbi:MULTISPECIES: prolipoprotein diacylglyceryl transferase [unclassified Curtobacterium]|uniref:prolipoprotein diacylglyceryl transferase n=1 Tax=unclassified Curtobacterium TaxID=257496 RepID=UPI000DA9F454|nr:MULTISPECIES: prolipoprotein diacylglyceryl transferase [unclassified Curtobacterium]PZE28809.1 prolipoprotein diacylglyceryl transferase [Curtobacterium sp. MCBD17_028]PZE77160.1 prolipoprotein diacylglyceryl transferase [Curtobacterium sp. MCBD17_019]PZF59160.1 prolipoprotein diacylglyceryl transferase [Curtobacterium sp. MCBD17_034]PZM34298.1 prolipoprotein diacylglyceryl transferase [Curtobacterium sp. MCBD17_031]
MLPLSIPSPSTAWQYFDLTNWLDRVFGWSFPLDFRIHAYAICILLGIVACVVITDRRLVRRGVEKWVIVDIAIGAVPLGIIGGRAYHVFTHVGDYFGPGIAWWEPFAIWEGGLAIFGALIAGALGAWWACRYVGLRFTTFVDAVAPGLLVAQAFGRLGNYFNHELFGMPTNLPWGLQIEQSNPAYPVGLPAGTLFHPTFLYEIIWNLVGFAVIMLIDRRFHLQWGRVLALYLIWYGAGRSVLESIRVDTSETFFGVRTNVWAALAAIVLGIVIFVVQTRRHPGTEPSGYLAGRGPRAASSVGSDDTYSESDDEPLVVTDPEPVATAADRS